MKRHGLVVLLVTATLACDSSGSSTPPEPTPSESTADATAEAPAEPEQEQDPDPAPEPEQEPEVSAVNEAVFTKDGFEARDLQCALSTPARNAARYIAAGLANQDEAIDACAPQGAALEVNWEYVGGTASNVSVVAESSKLAKCVMEAMRKVGAGVDASCTAIILIGDREAATAAYEAR